MRKRLWGDQRILLVAMLLVVAVVYWPGLSGGYVFDDFPNFVDNTRTEMENLEWEELKQAALASDSSKFRRPLAMLSLSVQRYFTGLDPFPLKLVNLGIHLSNALLIYLLLKALLGRMTGRWGAGRHIVAPSTLALLVAAGWALAPINLTGVLFIIQRMESLAAFFTLLGLLAYVHGRSRVASGGRGGLAWMWGGILGGVAIGVLAKETAVMLPLYALLIEWLFFGLGRPGSGERRQILALFGITLVLPMIAGMVWLLPGIVANVEFSNRPWDLFQRLWTEGRVLWHYLAWIVLPNPGSLTLYHDAFPVSEGPLTPWTTLPAALGLAGLLALSLWARGRWLLVSFGVLWFFVMHLLVSTVLNLELVYEHRNYLGSMGIILAVFSLLLDARWQVAQGARRLGVIALIALYGFLSFLRANEWSDPVQLAYFEATRHPDSPRAAYDFARMLLVSNPGPDTPAFSLATSTLRDAARLPNAGLLPWQGLVLSHARHGLPIPEEWWDAMREYVKTHNLTSQDTNALYMVLDPLVKGETPYPPDGVGSVLRAARTAHPDNIVILTMQANFLLNVTGELDEAGRLLEEATRMRPGKPAMWRNLIDFQLSTGQLDEAERSIETLESIDAFGRETTAIRRFKERLDEKRSGRSTLIPTPEAG